ncbi:IS30 family transposase [Kineosporia sp. NBRC 101731]|uniref:IS30 family transposase n=1 Tax=Kineosporia sp. NBRC 101731 TaxID=3032199 RepID=UPI00331D8ABE
MPGERLTFGERVAISAMLQEDRTFRYIGRVLGRSHTTISREVAADRDGKGRYYPRRAELDARRRRERPKVLRLAADHGLRRQIGHWLRAGASPAQACGRVAREHAHRPDAPRWRVSHTTVYNAIYVLGRRRMNVELDVALRTGRLRRMSRTAAAAGRDRERFAGMISIHERPAQAADRAVPGHWEGDLVQGPGNRSAIVTLVERRSRFLITCPLPHGKSSEHVITAIRQGLGALPADRRRSLTWDQGAEMARHADLKTDPDLQVYFCDPHAPWQRPSNENTNGLIRQYFPKGTDFSQVTDEELQEATYLLNYRPRQVLDFANPLEVFNDLLLADGATTT